MIFKDRNDAGRQLAGALARYRGHDAVYALPRGGVVIGAEIAQALDIPFGARAAQVCRSFFGGGNRL